MLSEVMFPAAAPHPRESEGSRAVVWPVAPIDVCELAMTREAGWARANSQDRSSSAGVDADGVAGAAERSSSWQRSMPSRQSRTS